MSGFVPASATQSGFSPAQGRGEPSGLHPRPLSSADSAAFSGIPGTGTGRGNTGFAYAAGSASNAAAQFSLQNA